MTHREKRVLFSKFLSQIVLWIFDQGWDVAYDEVTVHSPRWARRGVERLQVEDAVHKRNSFHHQGLAADINLYINGEWISDGGHPVWREIGIKWETMHELCVSGLRFNDANHLSFGEGSKLGPI